VKKTVLLILMLYAANTFYGQHKSRLFGYVNDADKRPIELVAVSVKGQSVGTTTNKNGFYSLELENKDSVELFFSCVGYRQQSRKLKPAIQLRQTQYCTPDRGTPAVNHRSASCSFTNIHFGTDRCLALAHVAQCCGWVY